MRRDLTDITLVVDRSGSMGSIRDDAEGGVNAFIEEQKKTEGSAVLTLVEFNTEYDFVHRGVSIQEVPRYQLKPGGMTALLDAVGRAINETGQRLAAIPEEQRPGLVVFVIVTDGMENSSREFTRAQIREMIQHQQEKYNWQFTFLGADQDAFAEAGAIGIDSGGVAQFAKGKVFHAYMHTASKVKRMRKQAAQGQEVFNQFTAEERRDMLDD